MGQGRSIMRSIMRRCGGLLALLTLVVLTAGLPIALYRVGGSPLPSRVPSLHRVVFVLLHKDNGALALGAVRAVSWLAWLGFALSVLAEVQAAIGHRRAPKLRLGGLQGIACQLVAVAALAFMPQAVVITVSTPARAATTKPVQPGGPAARAARAVPGAARVVVVRPGDCLWTIAERFLGAGDKYPKIVALNLGHQMDDGLVFTDPSLIQPGWRLVLPRQAASPGPSRVADRSGSRSGHRHGGHQSEHARFSAPHPGAGRRSGGRPGGGKATSGWSKDPVNREGVAEVTMFVFGVLAGAALAGIGRLMRRHRRQRAREAGGALGEPGSLVEEPVPGSADRRGTPPEPRGPAGNRLPPGGLEPFDPEGALYQEHGYEQEHGYDEPGHLRSSGDRSSAQVLRDALLELSGNLAKDGEPLPPIVGIHLATDSLEVLLSDQAGARSGQPTCWTVELDNAGGQPVPPAAGEVGDLVPGLFNAGATEAGGYLLVDLEVMGVTGCEGPPRLVDRLLVTAASEFASSSCHGWYDLVLAGCENLEFADRAELSGDLDEAIDLLEARARAVARVVAGADPADVRTSRFRDPQNEDWGLTLLISRAVPTPAQLGRLLDLAEGSGGVAALVAGDTRSEDGRFAPALCRLTPDGGDQMTGTLSLAYLDPSHEITVRPQTLTSAQYDALVAGPAALWHRPVASPAPPAGHIKAGEAHRLLTTGTGAARPGRRARHAAPNVRVTVLGSVTITGSRQNLRPKQAELVLALVLRSPAGLAGPELGSLLGKDADYPLPAGEVRRLIAETCETLGPASDGQEYIVSRGTGSYAPHEDLALDWAEFSFLSKRGRLARSRSDLRAALELVRGEPFADCYHWWIDAALVESIRAEVIATAALAACLELETGEPEAAASAARAGLLADPAAEELWRDLMRAQHQAGNPSGVAAAWLGCLDAVTGITPGGRPAPDTEQLFRQLTREAPIGSPR